jgi:biopolymer transport protein ExbD
MRRSRRRSRLPREITPLLDLAPMVDIVLNVLTFFLLATTFITAQTGLPVDLPQATTQEITASDLPTVSITTDQTIYIAGAPVPEASLVATLQDVMNQSGLKVVVLRADKTVPHGMAVRVMDLIKQAGAQRIAIATGGE